MKRIIAVLFSALLALGSGQALADNTTNNLAAAAAMTDSDLFPYCQGCSGFGITTKTEHVEVTAAALRGSGQGELFIDR